MKKMLDRNASWLLAGRRLSEHSPPTVRKSVLRHESESDPPVAAVGAFGTPDERDGSTSKCAYKSTHNCGLRLPDSIPE